MFYCTAFLM